MMPMDINNAQLENGNIFCHASSRAPGFPGTPSCCASYCPSENTDTLNSTLAQYLGGAHLLIPAPFNSTQFFENPPSVTFAPTTTNVNTNVSIDELRYYNYFSAAMYCPYTLENLTYCTCSHFNQSVTNYTIFRNDTLGTKVLLTYHAGKKEVVVSYRGSIAFINFLMDVLLVSINPQEVTENTIKVHRGQYICTMSLYCEVTIQIMQWIELYGNANLNKITINGHSLGGSMAQLTTLFWSSLDQFPNQELALITFGAPRAGNVAFADYMNSLDIKMARVVNRADLAPHIISVAQPTIPGDYYVHIMREVWANGTDIHYCSTTNYEDPTCSDSLDPLYSLVDHWVYLGVDYAYCYLVEGNLAIDLLTNPVTGGPSNLITPVVPRKIYEVLGNVEKLIGDLLYPPLG